MNTPAAGTCLCALRVLPPRPIAAAPPPVRCPGPPRGRGARAALRRLRLEATVARGVHISWFPRQLDLEPGLLVWKEPGVPDEIPDTFRSAGKVQRVTVMVPTGDEEVGHELEPT